MVSIFKAIRDNDTQLLNYFIELATNESSSSSTQAVSKQQSQWIQQQLKSSGQKQFDLNKRSSRGKTALHYAVTWNRVEMASSLINCAQVDVNMRDRENGWTALHRCLYLGNLEIARLLLKRQDIDLHIKDWEGLDAFELYNLTIANTFPKERILSKHDRLRQYDDMMDNVENEAHHHTTADAALASGRRGGTDLYTWGHNTNYVLGHPDTENRTKPERVRLQLESQKSAFIMQRPDYLIETVVMSKYHMGILTTENSHNLLLCGFGSGGRLGTGKETDTQFTPIPVPWSERITSVALGRDHTLAVTENGNVISFGNNSYGQLGYETDNHSNSNKDPMQLVPRKIQAQSLKKQPILGAAASRVHSVVYTTTDIFTFGLNQGQLGYHQPDNETCQVSPRKVSMSTEIVQVVANDHCTAILNTSFQVILLLNYTQQKLFFPVNRFPSNMTVHRSEPTFMVKLVASGTEYLGAVSNTGEVFTWTCRSSHSRQSVDAANSRNTKQMQPTVVSAPKRIWTHLNKPHLAAIDASIGQHGEMLVCTVSGHVFRGGHVDRFSQISHLQRCIRVCANASGAFAAIRSEYALPPITHIAASTLEYDLSSSLPQLEIAKEFHTQLCSLMQAMTTECDHQVQKYKVGADVDQDLVLKQQQATRLKYSQLIISAVDQAWHRIDQLSLQDNSLDVLFCVDKRHVYCHSTIVRCRSNMFSQLVKCADRRSPSIMNGMTIKLEKRASDGRVVIYIYQCQLASILLLLDYIYTDTYQHPMKAFFQVPDLCFKDLDSFTDKKAIQASAHQIQRDLVTLANVFQLPKLLSSAQQSFSHAPVPTLTQHLKLMLEKAKGTDVAIVTKNHPHSTYHQVILRQRCPYFKNLLQPGSVWIQKRSTETEDRCIQVNLNHIPKAMMDTIIQYIYVDQDKTILFNSIQQDKEESMVQFLLDFLCEADFLLLGRLKSITEQVLVPFIKLKSATTVLEYADACLADQLKKSCLEFISVNLPVFFASHMLDAVADTLLRDLEAYVRQAQINQAPTVVRGLPEQHVDADTEEDDIEFSSSLHALSRGDGSVVTFDEVFYTYYPEKPSIAKEKSALKTIIDTNELQLKQPSTTAAASRVKRGTKVQLNDLENELNMMEAASSQRRQSSAGWATNTASVASAAAASESHSKPSLREIIETENQPNLASMKSQKSAIPKKISQKERRRLAQQQEVNDTPSSSTKPVWGKVPAVSVKPMSKIMAEVADVPLKESTSSAAPSSSDRKGKKIYIPESLLEHIDQPPTPSVKETRPLYNPVDSLGASFKLTPIRRFNSTSKEDQAFQKKSFQSILKQQELEDNWLKSNKPKKSIALIQKEEQALIGLAQYYVQTLDILSGEWLEIKRL
ncbi:Rho GTPase [Mucor velutinosus]|uniref:Rho GTPase n=1 Tax=Mucor velutinosus TaxID=708070 RepID=A0AAN7D8R8_9FUNG|nr:Rho GTPase [Mucor velutinosus]